MEKEIPSKFQILQKKLSQLMNSAELNPKQAIIEINETIDEMNDDELFFVFDVEIFNKIHEKIEEKKLTIENAIEILKHFGNRKALENALNRCFEISSLCKRLEKMIIEEEKKKDEKNEKLLVNLCECDILLNYCISPEMLSICVPCLLKAALNKEENEETKEEVEMALLALSNVNEFDEIGKEIYFNAIKEIILYHQERHNLTWLAYQSAWQFLMNRFNFDKRLEEVIMNELHFAREAGREQEELMECVNRKREKEEEKEKEKKEELILKRWLEVEDHYFHCCNSRNEEYISLFRSVIKVFQAAKDNHREICNKCIHSLRISTKKGAFSADCLLKSRAIDSVLEEIHRPTLNNRMTFEIFGFFYSISEEIKVKNMFERKEAKRQVIIMKLLEKMEEEGLEDIITSFHEVSQDLPRIIPCTFIFEYF